MAYRYEYSSADTTVSWGGFTLEGLSPDAGITVTRNAPRTDQEVGMQGRTAVSINPDTSTTIALSFQQDSQGHRLLSDAYNYQSINRQNFRMPLAIKTNLGDLIVSSAAWMTEIPEYVWGSTATGSTRIWTFYAENVNTTNVEDYASVGIVLGSVIRQQMGI